ncbi:MAG: hypothetical protein JNK35_02875 [Phycisphaerae bacterium]|nr:hypothetical protein [Phycisphaerae bacterium]
MSQLMSAMNLWLFPTLALVFFLFAFILIMARLFAPGRGPELAHAATLPLDDGSPSPVPPTHHARPSTRPEDHA